MHELGLAEEIIRVADREAERAGASRVLLVDITVGQLMQVEVDSLLFLLDIVRESSPYTVGTTFEAITEPARLHCRSCGETWNMGGWVFLCDSCGSADVQTLSGGRLEVTDMEVEIDDDRETEVPVEGDAPRRGWEPRPRAAIGGEVPIEGQERTAREKAESRGLGVGGP